MGKLKSIKPRVGSLPPRVSVMTRAEREIGRDRWRDADQTWRKLYKTARWQRLRWSVLVRDLFTCQLCGHIEADTSQLVADHVEPHGGNEEKFWNGPLQTLCKRCHDGLKRGLEKSDKRASYRPEWLKASVVPLSIVCGPPASGKSHYVARRMGLNDLVIDLDLIVAHLSASPLRHDWDRERWLQPALFKRNAILGTLSRKPGCTRAWFVLSEPSAERRQWWQDKLAPEEIVVLETPEDVCLANAALDKGRDMQATAAKVRQWWSDYQPRQQDRVIRPQGG